MLITRIYADNSNGKIASITILTTDTSYDQIERNTAIGKNMESKIKLNKLSLYQFLNSGTFYKKN